MRRGAALRWRRRGFQGARECPTLQSLCRRRAHMTSRARRGASALLLCSHSHFVHLHCTQREPPVCLCRSASAFNTSTVARLLPARASRRRSRGAGALASIERSLCAPVPSALSPRAAPRLVLWPLTCNCSHFPQLHPWGPLPGGAGGRPLPDFRGNFSIHSAPPQILAGFVVNCFNSIIKFLELREWESIVGKKFKFSLNFFKFLLKFS